MQQRSGQEQLNLIKRAKGYLQKQTKRKSGYCAADPTNYLNSWSESSLGYLKLKDMQFNRVFSKRYLKSYFRNIWHLGNKHVFCRIPESNIPHIYKDIIVSWCFGGDFLEDGSFQCKYFNQNSRMTEDNLWMLISIDNVIPKKVDKNICVYYRKKSGHFSLISLAKNLIYCLMNRIPILTESLSARKLVNSILETIKAKYIKSILLPYEAQPWQHTLVATLKKKNPNIISIGDLHSCLPPLPTDFIKRYGAPDQLVVHGQGMKDILINLLGWDNQDIQVTPSHRYRVKQAAHLINQILLPYDFKDSKIIINQLEDLFQKHSASMPYFQIRNHPVQSKSLKHKSLAHEIEEVQKKYHTLYCQTPDRKVSIVIGATSCVVECLTHNIEVIHVVEDTVFDVYYKEVWKDISVDEVVQNIYSYKLKNKSSYILFDNSMLDNVSEKGLESLYRGI